MLGLWSGGNGGITDIREFTDATGTTFPILKDTEDTFADYTLEQANSPYPLDVVLDANGTIVYLSRSYDPDALHAAVESVLP